MIKIRTILCPVDFTPVSERVLRLAIEMCKKTGARVVLEHNLAVRPPDYLAVRWMHSEEKEASASRRAKEAPEKLRQLFGQIPAGIEHEAKLTRGPVDAWLVTLAEELPADVIVMATHGPSDASHRSLTEKAILRAPCPVLAIGESYDPASVFGARDEPPEKLNVLVPHDFSDESAACLSFALALAEVMPHQIHLLHVVADGAGRTADEVESELRAAVPEALAQRVTPRVAKGDPVPAIVETATEIGALFILMAAHGRGWMKRFRFSHATVGVLHRTPCPVLFLPPAVRAASDWAAA